MANDKDKGVVDFSTNSEYADRIAAVKAKVPKPNLPPLPRLDQVAPQPSGPAASSVAAAKRVLTPEQQEQLMASGKYIPGVGAAYVDNQPGMRAAQPPEEQGEYANPPRGPNAGLRPETVEQLEKVAEANKAEEEVKKDVEEVDDLETQFETDEFGRRVRSLTANRERREAIESRCAPMAVEDLILTGEIRQKVPIVPGKIEPTFRSMTGEEDLFIKRLISGTRGSEQYLTDRFSLLNLTAGLYSLNGRLFPNHLDKDGNPDEKLFDEKLKAVSRIPFILLSDFSINFIWFNRRVQKLLVIDKIKGF